MTDHADTRSTPAEAPSEELERLRLIHAFSQDIASDLDFDALLPRVLGRALSAVGAQGGSLWLAEGKVLRCKLALGTASQGTVGTTVPLGNGSAGEVGREQQTAVAADAMQDAGLEVPVDRGSGTVALTEMAAPMTARGETVGTIQVSNKAGDAAAFDERDRELLEGLAAAGAVAVRNAQRYSRVPLVGVLGAVATRTRALLATPRRRLQLYAVAAAALLAAVTLIRWPLRVAAWQPRLRASGLSEARTLVPGVVEGVYVREGGQVERGDSLARLGDAALRARRRADAAEMAVASRAAALAASEGDAATRQLQRTRAATLQQQIAVIDAEIASMTVRAPASGVVLTPRPEEQVGKRLDAGTSVITLGRTDTLTLDFGVAQRDISRILPGQEVRLRVDAFPQRTFEGRVTFLGELPVDSAPGVHFPVRATVPNPDDLLKPGMAAYARVLTQPSSLAGRALRGPARWLRLLWWRLWP